MNRASLIQKALDNIAKLPNEKIEEVSNYAESLIIDTNDKFTSAAIQYLNENSKTFSFLEEEPELYSRKDLKEKYK